MVGLGLASGLVQVIRADLQIAILGVLLSTPLTSVSPAKTPENLSLTMGRFVCLNVLSILSNWKNEDLWYQELSDAQVNDSFFIACYTNKNTHVTNGRRCVVFSAS